MAKVKVFQINDCDWWAGYDAESVLAAYMQETGCDREEALGIIDGIYPQELTEDDLLTNMITNDSDDGEEKEKEPFREALDKMIASGLPFPCFFASTEY